MKRRISLKVSDESSTKKKKISNKTLLEMFGINIDTFKIGSMSSNNNISTFLNEIKKRRNDSEEGVNISFNNDFFKETFFEAHRAEWETDQFSRMIVENTSQNEELKAPNNTKEDQDNFFFNFMERILNNKPKTHYSIKILSTIDGLNGMEIFRSEFKAKEDDFLNSLKVIMLSLRQCLVFMEILHDNTGYIYPIRAPSMENIGGKYRFSMTCVLPKPLMYYLQFKAHDDIFLASSLNVQNLVEILDPSASKTNTHSYNSETTSKTGIEFSGSKANTDSLCESPTKSDSSTSDVNCEDTLKESEKLNANILRSFFPAFLQKDAICIDNSAVFGDKFIDWDDHCVSAFEVKTQKDLEVLAHNCSCMIIYINKLFCFLHGELGISEENIKMEQFEELNGIEFDFNAFEYRFKHKEDSTERSNIYLVERFDGKNWEPFELMKEFIGEQSSHAYSLERRFNKLVINKDSDLPITISNLASECEIGVSEKDLLEFLYKSCIALNELHSVNRVHGDIKPAHLLKRDGKVYLIDFEFAQKAGQVILGFTKGYHPPEYNLESSRSRVSLQGDIYSLGISVLHILFRKEKISKNDINLEPNTIDSTSFVKDLELESDKGDRKALEQLEKEELMEIRNNIQSYLEKINCPILRDILTRMTETKPEDRIPNAVQIVNLLNPKNLITNQ